MARKPRPVDPTAGPLQEFAHDLRALREGAGNPTYRALAQKAGFSATALGEAAGGVRFPSLDVTLAYVGACGGDTAAWQERWRQVNSLLSVGTGEDRAAEKAGAQPGVSALSVDPTPTSRTSRLARLWRSRRVRVAFGVALVVIAGTAVLLPGGKAGPASHSAAAKTTANPDLTCPTFSKPGAFTGETYIPQTALRTEPNTEAHLLRNIPAGCWLQFTGYCLGAVVLDRNMVDQALPDERWYELEGGGVVASAVIHDEPPNSMQPNSCPGSIAAPTSISLGIVADRDVPGWAVLSAHGSGLHIAGYAAYFTPVDAPGTAPDWHEIGVPTSATAAADGFNVPWTFGKASEAPDGTPTLVVAAACLGGDAPTSVTDAVRVVPSKPSTAKPAVVSAAMLAEAARAACTIP